MGNNVNNFGGCDCIGSMASAITASLLAIAYACSHIFWGFLMVFYAILGRFILEIFNIIIDNTWFTELITNPVSFVHILIICIAICFIVLAIVLGIMSCVLLFLIMKEKPGKVTAWLVVSGIHLGCTIGLLVSFAIILMETSVYFYIYAGLDVGLGIILWIIIFSYERRVVEESDVGGIEEASVEFTNAK